MKISKYDVLAKIQEIHSNQEDFTDGDLEERILKADYYELTTVCPQFIEVEFAINEDKVLKFSQLNPSNCPPVVLIDYGSNDYSLIDGSHRIEAFKSLGITTINAYVGKFYK